MSDYKTILVHIDPGKTTPARLDVAVELASTFDSHLACLYAVKKEYMPSGAMEAREMLLEAQKRLEADGRAIVIVGLAAGIAIYGLIVAVILIGRT